VLIRTTIAALAILVSAAATALAADGPDVLVAHRGVAAEMQAQYGLPENFIPAWGWAVTNGADIVDVDVQVTKNGALVVVHDTGTRGLERTTDCTGSVRSMTLAQVQTCWLELPVDVDLDGDHDDTEWHPPSLNQALEFLRGKVDYRGIPIKIAIEMKGSGWSQYRVDRLRDMLKNKGLLSERVNVHSFSLTVTGYAKKAGIPNRGYVVPAGSALPTVTTLKKYATNVLLMHADATPSKVTAYNNAGIKVWLWTMDTTSEYELAWSKGKVYAWVVDDLLGARTFLDEAP
jgi:glycerophosphoryl diester phosphodiesterase